ncbi:MAG: hypothetical protein R3E13_05150 [Alphaproteobacteria bacterium]
MDVLNKLSVEERTLIVSLPYRAGLWVSQSDSAGGDEADEKEHTALANIVDGFSQNVFGSELLQYIMNETVGRKDEWPVWEEASGDVLRDCARALDVLRGVVDEKDVSAYSMRLMEIGEAVALAFREYEEGSALEQFRVYVSYLFMKLKRRLGKRPSKSFDQFLSISARERKALGKLAKALGTTYA